MKMQKVLLVDDDKNIREVAQMCLEDDWTVLTASSGFEAITVACAEHPDLILLDMMMPGMDGPTTMKHIREAGLSTPVIFLTAKVQTHEVSQYEKLGAIGLIAKPFNPMSLADDIRRFMDA